MGLPFVSKAVSSAPVNNDGSVVLWGGSTNSAVTKVIGRAENGASLYIPGKVRDASTTAQVSDTNHTGYSFKAISNGRFAEMRKQNYLIPTVTAALAGVATDILKFAASAHGIKPIAFTNSQRVLLYQAAGLNVYTGEPVTTPSNVFQLFARDETAQPSKAIPGELQYQNTGGVPKMADYEAKNG